jgi:NADP-dependent 3-hydroxy acid dehydrogenase YdfG
VNGYTTALVTGASGGIGMALVRSLREEGLHVHAVAYPDSHVDALGAIEGVTVHAVDVRDVAGFDAVLAEVGSDIDVVVNNAGIIGDMQPAQSSSTGVADALVDVNLRAALHATLAVLPAMVQRNRGHIVFTGSVAAYRPTANTAVYSATKAALLAFADGLRLDLHGTGVRVTVLAPGRVETRLYDEALGGHDRAVQRLYTGVSAIQPDELAALVTTVLSMPAHVDVTRIEVVPTMQVFGGSDIARTE